MEKDIMDSFFHLLALTAGVYLVLFKVWKFEYGGNGQKKHFGLWGCSYGAWQGKCHSISVILFGHILLIR